LAGHQKSLAEAAAAGITNHSDQRNDLCAVRTHGWAEKAKFADR
jgi:hypothetical protein